MLSEKMLSILGEEQQPIIPPYKLSSCYNLQRIVFKPSHMSKFVLETLFYIFYNMPFDRWQSLAAQELAHKQWKFYEERNLWVIERKNLDEEVKKRISPDLSEWITFDYHKWEYVAASNIDPSKLVTRMSVEGSTADQSEAS